MQDTQAPPANSGTAAKGGRSRKPKPSDGNGQAEATPNKNDEKKLNKPIGLDLALVNSIQTNRSATERRTATLPKKRPFKKAAQINALLHAIACTDLTTLKGDDTVGRVMRLCHKALNPVRPDILAGIGREDLIGKLTTGAICVYHHQLAAAVEFLNGRLPIAVVSTGFPHGQAPLETRVREIAMSIEAGATEVDVVARRELAITGQWKALYDEFTAMREACEGAKLKTIIETGDLQNYELAAKVSAIAIMAGADTIKTSTGTASVNATLPISLVMVREIKRFLDMTDGELKVGFKPAGGIRTAKDAYAYLALMLEVLDDRWAEPDLFRIGASGLVTDLERQLSHHATGRYANTDHLALG